MINPLELVHLWFKKQSEEVKLETALLVLYSLPDGGYPNPESAEADFLAWLLPVQNMPKDIGKAIIVRSLIDFTCGNRFTRAGWNETGNRLRQAETIVKDKAKDIGLKPSDALGKCPERQDFRSAHWIKAGESWRALCERELADQSLRDFSGYLTGRIRK